MKKAIKIFIFLLIVALLVIGAVRLVKKKKDEEAAIPLAKEYAVIAKTVTAEQRHVTLTTPYLALVKSDKELRLAAKFPARVLQIINEGAKVHRGDLLARLDDTALRSELSSLAWSLTATKNAIAATKVALSNLYATHKRTKKLYAVRGASQEELEREESKIAETRAKLASLRAKAAELKSKIASLKNELSYTMLKAPFDGTIGKKFVNVGDIAMQGRPLLTLIDPSSNYLLVRVPAQTKVYGLLYKGKRIAVRDTRSTFNSLRELRADVNDPALVPGERAEVELITYDGEGTLLPQDAILSRDGKNYVLIAQGDHATPQEVHIVASSDSGAVVAENLDGKEVVVAKPDILLKLLSGIKLRILKD